MKRILCYGDSNTWGYMPVSEYSVPLPARRYARDVRWTGILSKNPDWEVIEEGLCGRTGSYPKFDRLCMTGADYFEACILSHEPLDVITVMLGTNDMSLPCCNNAYASARGVAGFIRTALGSLVISPGVKVLLISPAHIEPQATVIWPTFDQRSVAQSREFSRYFKEQADANGWDFLDAAKVLKPSSADGLHFDEKSHSALARAVWSKLCEMLS